VGEARRPKWPAAHCRFLTDDVVKLEERKAGIEERWRAWTQELGERHIRKHGHMARDGRPPRSWAPARPAGPGSHGRRSGGMAHSRRPAELLWPWAEAPRMTARIGVFVAIPGHRAGASEGVGR
jgi:hypothetical protein